MKPTQKIALSPSAAFIAFSLVSTAPLLGACVMEEGGVDRVEQATSLQVEVCHQTTSDENPYVIIVIGEAAVNNHLSHGDTLGQCPTSAPAPDAAPPPPPPPEIDAAPPTAPPPPPPPPDAAPAQGEPDAEVLAG